MGHRVVQERIGYPEAAFSELLGGPPSHSVAERQSKKSHDYAIAESAFLSPQARRCRMEKHRPIVASERASGWPFNLTNRTKDL